jgi:hypothetical protein
MATAETLEGRAAGGLTVDAKLTKLLEIGFVAVGHWVLTADSVACELSQLANFPNALYAFTVDGNLKYIGKTTQTLRNRMSGYRNPGPTQSTNIRNNQNIQEALHEAKRVDIYIFRDMGLMKFGGFHLNLAAGLEDSLVRDLAPPWNGGRKDAPDQDATIPQPAPLALSEVMPTDEEPDDQGKLSTPSLIDEPVTGTKITTDDFREALRLVLLEAAQRGLLQLDVRSGELHKRVGGRNQMPQVCSAMRSLMEEGDAILESPPKGNGSRLVIRYKIPRAGELTSDSFCPLPQAASD